jgi:peptide deformylase
MILPVVQVGDPVLRGRAREIARDELRTPFVQELIASMRHTLKEVPGVGLAAPQVGEALRIVVIVDRPQFLETMSRARLDQLGRQQLHEQVLVNPTLEPIGDRKVEYMEGCLSVPGLSAAVSRWEAVRVRALDQNGVPVEHSWTGWPARILQHEVDHLNGVLYVDRMDARTLTTADNHKRWWKARSVGEIRAAMAAGAR